MSEQVDFTFLVQQATKSEYFTGIRIANELRNFLASNAHTISKLGSGLKHSVNNIYLVGSGGSFANLLSVKYIFDSLLEIPTEAFTSYEFIWRNPSLLNSSSLVFFGSLSGETEDTVAALRFAKLRGAKTIAAVGRGNSTLAKEAGNSFVYSAAACYEGPFVTALMLGISMTRSPLNSGLGADLLSALRDLPSVVESAMVVARERANKDSRLFLDSSHIYVLGSGPLSPLAYKFAMSVIMENMRIGGTYSDAVEFRHGPVEALDHVRPDFIFLLGTDESRALTQRTIEFCKTRSNRLLVFDAADFGAMHPLLTPLVMNSVIQWFVVYSALLRGISDLDERIFMGQGLLAVDGATWP